jgi:hypothetical protein
MSRSYWLPIIAAIGLACSLVGTVLAQPPKHEQATAPHLAIAGQTPYRANAGQLPTTDAPLPIRIVQSAAEVKHGQEREDKSDDHDVKDLDAQMRAANAAEKQITLGWAVAILTFAGTCLLIGNLLAARRAIAQSEEHARIGLRAYVDIQPTKIALVPIKKEGDKWLIYMKIECRVENSGNTPAEDVRACADIRVVTWPPPDNAFEYSGVPDTLSSRGIAPKDNVTHTFEKPIFVDLDRLKSGTDRIILLGKLSFFDVWGAEYPSTFEGSCVEMEKTIDAFERQIGLDGTANMADGGKFLWRRPDKKQPDQKK